MHAPISYDVAKAMLDDRLKAADQARLAHELRAPRGRRQPLRSAVGHGLIALGGRMASRTQAPQHHP